MPLALCSWCGRSRLTQLQVWRSPRSGEQLCGQVCGHCFLRTGPPDDCRTCRARAAREQAAVRSGVRPLQRDDVLQLMLEQSLTRRRRAT